MLSASIAIKFPIVKGRCREQETGCRKDSRPTIIQIQGFKIFSSYAWSTALRQLKNRLHAGAILILLTEETSARGNAGE